MSRRKPRTGGVGIFEFTPDGDVQPAEIRDNPLRRPCPYCHVAAGTACRVGQRTLRAYHPARRQPATERTEP